jgi:hypothetical protein
MVPVASPVLHQWMPIPSGVAHLSRGGNAFPAVASKGRWAMSMREEKRVALGTAWVLSDGSP